MPAASPWRTVLTVLAVCGMQLAGFLYAVHRGLTAEVAAAFGSLCLWSTAAAGAQAAKATAEHVANGSGWSGVKAALLTDAKPGEPAP